MQVEFATAGLEQMDKDPKFCDGLEPRVADEYRHRLQILRSANSEEQLAFLRALDLQEVDSTSKTFQMRVTNEYRLELKVIGSDQHNERHVVVTGVIPVDSGKGLRP